MTENEYLAVCRLCNETIKQAMILKIHALEMYEKTMPKEHPAVIEAQKIVRHA
jgi:deoxycytidylate deaminase